MNLSIADFALPVFLSFSAVIFVGLAFSLRLFFDKSKVGLERQKIELEIFRKSIERSMYAQAKELAANKDRWEDVNHMLYEASRKTIDKSAPEGDNRFLRSLSIDRSNIKVDLRSAFLLAPIHPLFAEQLDIIKSSFKSVGMNCETADEEFISGPILSVIVKKILASSVVVALIDGRNPNVFYEIGLAHAFGKTVLMITNGVEDVPFDIKSQRLVVVNWEDIDDAHSKIQRAVIDVTMWSDINYKEVGSEVFKSFR